MKKFLNTFAAFISVALISASSLYGCSSNNNDTVSIDTNKLISSITSEVAFEDTLIEVADDYSQMLYGVSSDMYNDCRVFTGSGATSEQIALYDCVSADAAKQVYDILKEYIAALTDSYASYIPAEVERLEHTFLDYNDHYVFLCVTADYETSENIIDTYFKNIH